MYHKNQPNVGQYTSPMDGMGYLKNYFSCWDDKGLSLGAYSKKLYNQTTQLWAGFFPDFRDDKLHI